MKRSRENNQIIEISNSKTIKELRKFLRQKEKEIWNEKLSNLKIPEFVIAPFGHIADFDFELHVASFKIFIVLSKEPDYITKNGFLQKNKLPDGCLRIDIEAKTQDGTKHGYGGFYSLIYSDLAKIEFMLLEKTSYRKVLTMCKLDYSIHTDNPPDEWIIDKIKSDNPLQIETLSLFTEEIIEYWKTLLDDLIF
jgi:hypothetical protein